MGIFFVALTYIINETRPLVFIPGMGSGISNYVLAYSGGKGIYGPWGVSVPTLNPGASWFDIFTAIPSRRGWWKPWMIIPGAGGLETCLNQEKKLTHAPSFSTIKMTSHYASGGRT
jgi:hypothetical protein